MKTALEKLKASGVEPSTMPKKLKAKWLKGLRSGKYKRGKHALYNEQTGGFCCLGVLEHVVSGGVEYTPCGIPKSYPSKEWAEEHDIKFNHDFDCKVFYGDEVIRLSSLNDHDSVSFKQIANIIDKQVIGV